MHHVHSCHKHHHHGERPTKVGILLSVFGTTVADVRHYYDDFEEKVHQYFPRVPIFRAYTADKVRRKIKKHAEEAFTVTQALTHMHDLGFTHVAVQSLHTVPGVEYEWTIQQAKALEHPRKGLQKVTVGLPLMTERFIHEVVEAMPSYIPTGINKEDAVIFVGHGTYHDAQIYYHALQGFIHTLSSNYIMGTLMGDGLDLDTVVAKLKMNQIKKIHLVPFLCVPGHHFMLDIVGKQANSWLSALQAEGFECAYHHIGTLAHKPFAKIWLENLHVALLQLGEDVHDCLPPLPGHVQFKVCPKDCNHGHSHNT